MPENSDQQPGETAAPLQLLERILAHPKAQELADLLRHLSREHQADFSARIEELQKDPQSRVNQAGITNKALSLLMQTAKKARVTKDDADSAYAAISPKLKAQLDLEVGKSDSIRKFAEEFRRYYATCVAYAQVLTPIIEKNLAKKNVVKPGTMPEKPAAVASDPTPGPQPTHKPPESGMDESEFSIFVEEILESESTPQQSAKAPASNTSESEPAVVKKPVAPEPKPGFFAKIMGLFTRKKEKEAGKLPKSSVKATDTRQAAEAVLSAKRVKLQSGKKKK